jgi:TPR repeat protein
VERPRASFALAVAAALINGDVSKMRTAPHIALYSLLLICGCILLFEMVAREDAGGGDREKLSEAPLRLEDFPSYLAYAEAVAQKNERINTSRRARHGPHTQRAASRKDTRREPAPRLKVTDFPSYEAYVQAVTKENSKSIKLMAAERGDMGAQLELGLQYLHGDGVSQDYSLAAKWLGAAAENGSAVAQYEFGMMHVRAQGLEEDYETAARWISLSAQQGFASAQHQLAMAYSFGFGIEKNEALALRWYLLAAEQGYPETQWHLAAVYSGGLLGVEKDPDLALRYYKLAAAQGHPEAQAALAHAYFFGEGVEADIEAAYRWSQAAAKQGVARSQWMLGNIYLGGGALPDGPVFEHLGHEQFMPEDKVRAQMWFLLAAENGDEGAEWWTQVFEERLTYHEAKLARGLAEACLQSSYRRC